MIYSGLPICMCERCDGFKPVVVDAPEPVNNKDKAARHRAPLHLIPGAAEIEEAYVMSLGAQKYGAFNWRDAEVIASVYISAARRHLMQWFDGEDIDSESGYSHLAHARACLGILLDAQSLAKLRDDRPKAGAATELLARFKVQQSGGSGADSSDDGDDDIGLDRIPVASGLVKHNLLADDECS
jgi:hypothetical protein